MRSKRNIHGGFFKRAGAFYGSTKRRKYFEGWYVKQNNGHETVAFIPAFHVDSFGKPSASMQAITSAGSYHMRFSACDFYADEKGFNVNLGANRFTINGAEIDFRTKDVSICGSLSFSEWTPLQYDIMGPFRFVPFMQCSHGVLSLFHRVDGMLSINGSPLSFINGTGYIETDRGISFPSVYLWTQCNWHADEACCIMLSIADIPFLGARFTGCIGCVFFNGREYRFATYLGVKIERFSESGAYIRQGDMRLVAELIESNAHSLWAPESGDMIRTIHEHAMCTVRYRFEKSGETLLDFTCSHASFEFAR